jgi:hypothetical protein
MEKYNHFQSNLPEVYDANGRHNSWVKNNSTERNNVREKDHRQEIPKYGEGLSNKIKVTKRKNLIK